MNRRTDAPPQPIASSAATKVRLIIASGAHPRYARNLGTGEPLATATNMVPARQEVLHGPDHISSLKLLVTEGG